VSASGLLAADEARAAWSLLGDGLLFEAVAPDARLL